ncbi:hypothetical protein ACFO4E_22865 [Nocardiopsis mangrovi]|uniref:Uncharacterized protein n=1 Tax=Nocardiopsis mangrovi TaxID=1179818 RepID=A0ABV9E0Q7_9ACTN
MNHPHYGPAYGPPYGPPNGYPPGPYPPQGPPPPAVTPHIDIQALQNESLDEARLNLRVIMNNDPSTLGTDKLAYSVNPGLTALIVRRLPDPSKSVLLDKRHTHRWGCTKADLWGMALANMAYEPVDFQSFQTDADTSINVVKGDGWPGAAHVMRLPEIVREPMPFGAILMMPNSNVLLYAVLRSQRSRPLISFLYNTALSLADGDLFVEQLLWWREGKLHGMSARPDPGGGVQLRQNKEFTFLLDHELPAY